MWCGRNSAQHSNKQILEFEHNFGHNTMFLRVTPCVALSLNKTSSAAKLISKK